MEDPSTTWAPGDYLKKCREDAHYGQRQLARITGRSQGYISKLEDGKFRNPKWETYAQLIQACNGDLAHAWDLWGEAKFAEVVPLRATGTLRPRANPGLLNHLVRAHAAAA